MTTLPTGTATTKGAVAAFVDGLKTAQPGASPAAAGGRLIFALDATASRKPTWDTACRIQGEMFETTASLGGLACQVAYYRGYDECRASKWLRTASDLHRVMRSVSCVGGETQIERVLEHTLKEAGRARVGALVFIGDAVEEKLDRLCRLAGELGSQSVPIFTFHEGSDSDAAAAFRQMATLSHGAYLTFDHAGIARLKELLAAIAVFATGGYAALQAYGEKHGGEVLQLTHQLRKGA